MIRVAINGFGRIGRLACRLMLDSKEFDVVAINTSSGADTLAYLLKYDSAHGKYKTDDITYDENSITVENKVIKISSEKDPSNCAWKELDIDLVLECSGKFVKKEDAEKHIEAGAKKVLISAPGKGDLKTVVYNVNHDILTAEDRVVSGASCTTNCLAPAVKVLNDKFGIVMGYMTTVHAYTNDQNLLDNSHKKGIWARRGRSATNNIVPTSTGAASAIGLVIPELNGKLDGIGLRVPTITGSVVDLVVELKLNTSAEEVNEVFKAASNETLGYTAEPIVSSDIIGCRCGGMVDGLSTNLLEVDGKQMIKLIVWYDNEMSYTAQLLRTAAYMCNLN